MKLFLVEGCDWSYHRILYSVFDLTHKLLHIFIVKKKRRGVEINFFLSFSYSIFGQIGSSFQ